MKRFLPVLLLLICFTYTAQAEDIYTHIARGNTVEVNRWLDRWGDVNMADKNGNTPLLVAADAGNLDIVRLLLANGADVNAVNKHGYTPLFAAVTGRHPLVITELIRAGAYENVENAYGSTIQEYVKSRNYNDLTEYTLALVPAEAKLGPISLMYIPLWERQADRFFNEGKVTEGSYVLKFAAEKGDAHAQYRLGTFYKQNGHTDLSIDYLTRSAAQGYLTAQEALGRYYTFEGRIKPAYAPLGFQYTKQAADQGYAAAMLETGKAYLYGIGTAVDYDMAGDYLNKAYEMGLIDGRYYMALMFYHGLGFEENRELGLSEIYEAAAEGSRPAQQQIRRFNTEAVLDYISGFTHNSPRPVIKTYMLSQGAVLLSEDTSCDTYDVSRFIYHEYGIYRINICELNSDRNSMSFNIYRFIKPEFRGYFDEYAKKTDVEYIFDGGL